MKADLATALLAGIIGCLILTTAAVLAHPFTPPSLF